MGFRKVRAKLGLVTGDVIEFPSSRVKPLDAKPLARADDGAVLGGDRTAEHLGGMEKRRVVT